MATMGRALRYPIPLWQLVPPSSHLRFPCSMQQPSPSLLLVSYITTVTLRGFLCVSRENLCTIVSIADTGN